MLYYLTAAALVALTFFWGAGLALAVTPRRWRSFWPLLALPLGLALQSAVVWAAGWLPLAGTDVYARACLVLPLSLLLAAGWWIKRASWRALRANAGALALTLLVALLAVSPWAKRGGALTSIASGSCDVADYAAGARVLKEFRPADRTGFIGQREVAGILSVDNFHDHWRQLNHFTPAALLALHASTLGRPVHEIASVLGVLLLATLVPLTVLLARTITRLPVRAALAAAALVGLGAIQGYAVYQVALGQMLAAAAVGVLTWGTFGLMRAARNWRAAWAYAAVIALAWWLLLGSYAFFIVVAFAPASGVFAAEVFGRRDWSRLARGATVLVAAVLGASGFGWERLAGFALRWRLHDTIEYGWPIPRVGPDGWIGLVSSAELQPLTAWASWTLAGLLLGAFFWSWRRRAAQDVARAWTIAGLVGPAVAGYAILSVKGAVPGSNASYDAYKLLACFQPVLIVGLLWWWRYLRGGAGVVVPVVAVMAVWWAGVPLRARAAARPLVVYPELSALQQWESEPVLRSVNILCDEMWPRLWANAFLLRKEQYFAVPTYEGRTPTRLQGEWDLRDSFLRVKPAASDRLRFNRTFTLTRAQGKMSALQPALADGWYPREQAGGARWHWSNGQGRIVVTNISDRPRQATLTLKVRAFQAGAFSLQRDDQILFSRPLGVTTETITLEDITFLPGTTTLWLRNAGVSPAGGDARSLGVLLSDFVLQEI